MAVAAKASIGLLVLALVAAAGCLHAKAPQNPDESTNAFSWQPDCASPRIDTFLDSPCVQFFSAPIGRNLEPSIATHPTDPNTILLTWTERGNGPAKQYSAITHDGGLSWLQQRMHDPALGDTNPAGGEWFAFDGVADFLPNGDPVIFFAGEDATTGQGVEQDPAYAGAYFVVSDRMTLARSRDQGVTWSYHAINEMPGGVLVNDYVDFAVAPDTGELYVVSPTFSALAVTPYARVGDTGTPFPLVPTGTYFWKSADGGESWSVPARLKSPSPDDAYDNTRIAAGPDGLIAISMTSFPISEAGIRSPTATAQHVDAFVSRDGGRSFNITRLQGDAPANGPPLIHVGAIEFFVYTGPREISRTRSTDAGATWTTPEIIATLPESAAWMVGAAGPQETFALLARYDNTYDGAGEAVIFGVQMVTRQGTLDLAGPVDKAPTFCGPGDDYGGLAFAADGSLWAAWSDPRGSEHPRVSVAHLTPRS